MIEGISTIIIKQFILNKIAKRGSVDNKKGKLGQVKGIDGTDLNTDLNLEDLNIPGIDEKKAEEIGYLVKKLLKQDIRDAKSSKEIIKRKKEYSLEIEKRMNKYMSDKEKELVGILLNKLI